MSHVYKQAEEQKNKMSQKMNNFQIIAQNVMDENIINMVYELDYLALQVMNKNVSLMYYREHVHEHVVSQRYMRKYMNKIMNNMNTSINTNICIESFNSFINSIHDIFEDTILEMNIFAGNIMNTDQENALNPFYYIIDPEYICHDGTERMMKRCLLAAKIYIKKVYHKITGREYDSWYYNT